MTPATRRILLGVAAAGAVAALVLWDFEGEGGGATSWPRAALGWVLVVVGCGALWWRRRWPVQVAALTLVCSALYFPLAARDLPLLLIAFAIALFTVAAEGHLVAAGTLAAVTLLALVVSEQVVAEGRRHVDDTDVFLLTGWFVGLVAAGNAYSTRLAYLREAEQRALAAEREKDVRARQSAAEERLRIARELHDVLGHNISLINVQSGAALHRYAKRGGQAAAEQMVPAMEAVRDTSRAALRELRATLGVLRQVDDAAAPTAPAATGPAAIAELADRTSGAGLRVRTEFRTEPGSGRDGPDGSDGPDGPDGSDDLHGASGVELPPQVGAAVYRIVQEALTNVVRHAGAATATVRVSVGRREVRVSVEDDGSGVATGAPAGGEAGEAGDARGGGPEKGSGLDGMAERARALGGELTAGNVTDAAGTVRGFRVEARLPVREGTA